MRIASHPKYPNSPGDVTTLCPILRDIRKTAGHHFWNEDLSLPEMIEPEAVITHAQITDVYLLGLAVRQKGKLATLDHRIPVGAVRGGRQAIELIFECKE